MIGGDGLERELTDVGFTVDRDPSPILPAAAGERVTLPSYDAVLVGRDTVFSYNHLHMACHILQTQPVSWLGGTSLALSAGRRAPFLVRRPCAGCQKN